MKIEFEIENLENTGEITPEMLKRFAHIFRALIKCGGLTGVKSGKTIIHFDHQANFKHIQLDYVPWYNKDR